ncbi:MAG: serine hydrolase [Flavobacteriales bacterium]|nr:serine hydrolase [Flavobacteriales bacterium]
MRAILFFLATAAVLLSNAQAPPTIPNKDMDALLSAHFEGSNAPGACILVAKGGQVIYRRATGSSDLTIPLATDAVFRIGSITKQFTAMAVLQLVHEGKLTLTDELQTHLDFPKKDWSITVEQLLTHTAGVPNYTDLASFTPANFAKDASLAEVIATFKDLPLEFEPGTKWKYSNSGYVLLGALIERLSGMSWEMYLNEHFFGPLGMARSNASAANGRLTGEPQGFQKGEKGWEPGVPLSMTWPHGAGAIRSTVDDLFAWNSAVMTDKLIPADLRGKAHTDHQLKNGEATKYGYGWSFLNVQGSPSIEHNGGINGFTSASLYLPKEDIYAVVLSNAETNAADALAPQLAAIALGKPYPTGVGITVPIDELKKLEGVYLSTDSVKRYITADEQGLHAQREGSTTRDLVCVAPDTFFYKGDVTSLEFVRQGGKVIGAHLLSRSQDEQIALTDLALPARTEVKLDTETLKRYTGEFELSPGFTITFRVENDKLFGRATGQPEFEMFAEGPDKFFLKVVDARIEFYPAANGSVERMTLFQGGAMEGKRIK